MGSSLSTVSDSVDQNHVKIRALGSGGFGTGVMVKERTTGHVSVVVIAENCKRVLNTLICAASSEKRYSLRKIPGNLV